MDTLATLATSMSASLRRIFVQRELRRAEKKRCDRRVKPPPPSLYPSPSSLPSRRARNHAQEVWARQRTGTHTKPALNGRTRDNANADDADSSTDWGAPQRGRGGRGVCQSPEDNVSSPPVIPRRRRSTHISLMPVRPTKAATGRPSENPAGPSSQEYETPGARGSDYVWARQTPGNFGCARTP